MKKSMMAMLMIAVLAAVALTGCMQPSVDSNLASGLEKPHNLRKMFEKDINYSESRSSWGGGFFLFFGAAGGDSHSSGGTVSMVRFAWEDKDGSYIISDLPLTKVRVKIVEQETKTPTVQFFLKSHPEYTQDYDQSPITVITKEVFDDDTEKFWKNYLAYVLITCSAEDWPENIKLPLNE